MKIYLFKSNTIHEKHLDSLQIALQFHQGSIHVFSNYQLPDYKLENVITTFEENLEELLEQETDPVLVAHSETIFIADSLNDVFGAYSHYSMNGKVLIQLPIHTVLLIQPKPTLTLYGGRKFWLTGTQLFTNQDNPVPVAYGDPKILYKYINNDVKENYFHDGIFHGGDTLLITAFPPLAFDTRFEEVPTFSLASLDPQNYISSIPSYNKEQNETLSGSD